MLRQFSRFQRDVSFYPPLCSSIVPIRRLEFQSQPCTRLGARGDCCQEGYYRCTALHCMGGIAWTQNRTYPG